MFVMTLVALNGFTGRSGEYAVLANIIWSSLVVIVCSGAALVLGLRFGNNENPRLGAFWLSMGLSLILGLAGVLGGIVVAIVVAEALWKR
jgi:hypothetical protein